MIRRNAKPVAVYLLLGMLSTWAVAWWCVVAAPFGSSKSYRHVVIVDEREIDITVCLEVTRPGLISRGYGLLSSSSGAAIPEVTVPIRKWPSWSVVRRSGEPLLSAHEQASGWPLLSMRCQSTHSETAWSVSRGITLSAFGGWREALPLVPIWPGLLADTVFYAALFAALHQPTTLARRSIRRKRGHCPACNYDLQGLDSPTCPECGRKP